MKTVAIVGFGRFGKTLYRLIKDDFNVVIYDSKDKKKNIKDVYSSDVIFFCVPIGVFESVIKQNKKYFTDKHLLIDVLSVKMHPKRVFEKYLTNTRLQALLTHPMFGPDSSKNGFDGLPIILDKFRAGKDNYLFWKNYFKSKKLRVVEMSSKEHDKLAASSQGLTHFIGRLLEAYKFTKTPIDSLGSKKLYEVLEQTTNDTWQLFYDLQHFNPYTNRMRIKLGEAYDKLYNKLLPKHVKKGVLTIGIQGGKGSFNEEAIQYFIKRDKVRRFSLKYLYTSESVLKALHKGEIDRGQFAIHNSVGGIVGESIEAMARYKFRIVEEYAIKISHALMIRKDAKFDRITTIMTHPQVLAQCKTTLLEKYPHLEQTSGKGQMIDHAVVAKHLSQNRLPKHIATMGSKVLAKMYNLVVVEDNLQDSKENYTSFLQVERL